MKQLIIFLLLLSLLGCQTAPADITPELEITQPPASASTETPPDAEQLLRADVIAQIQADPNYQSVYVQALEEVSGQSIPETCADFAVKLGTLEDVTITLDSFANCVILANDGSQAIYPMPNGEFLYVTDEGGRAFLEAQGVDAAGAVFSVDPSSPFYGEMRDADGRRLTVATRSTRQWRLVDEAGQVLDDAGDVLMMPTAQAPTGEGVAEVRLINEAALKLLVEKYLNAPFDTSSFTLEQHAAFSLAFTERLNASAPIVSFNNNEAYINPDSLEMLQYADGVSEADKKFETFVAVKEDADGNLSFFDADSGEYVLIPGSKGMDWRMLVDDQEDTGITWPITEKFNDQFTDGQNMTLPQRWLTKAELETANDQKFFTPVILLRKQRGNIFLDIGMGESSLRDTGMISFGKPILDVNDTVIAIQEFLAIPDGRIIFFAEGENWEGTTPGWVIHPKNVREHLGELGIYYIGLKGKQGAWLKDLNAQAFPQVAFDNEAISLVKDGKASKTKVTLVEIVFVIEKKP